MRLVSRCAPSWCALLLSCWVAAAQASATVETVSPSIVALGHRVAEQLPFLVETLGREAPVLGIEIDGATVRDCATADWDGVCRAVPLERARRIARRCRHLLSNADAGLERAGGTADGMRGLAATGLRQSISTEAIRLSALLRALSLGGCERAWSTAEPVSLTLLDGGRRVLVDPERGLDPTRRWTIRTVGSAGVMLEAEAGPVALPDVPVLSAARSLAGRLEDLAREAPRWPAFPAFIVDLPEPAPRSPFWHAPVRLEPDASGGILPHDPRDALAHPARPAECPARVTPAPEVWNGLGRRDAMAGVWRGSLPSGVRFLLAVPRTPIRGVVVLVHSLESDARTILDLVAADLAGEGLASAAFDLPLHGERARSGERFLSPEDLGGFRRHALGAVDDVLALTAVIRHCPETTSLPSDLARDRVGLLGYSIGGAIGLLALAADPGLQPAVMIAPAGEIADWQSLLLARSVGLVDKICIGDGSDATCTDDATCGPRARCERHPGLWLLGPAVVPPLRLLVGDAEPLGASALLRPPVDARPLLVQYATEDWIVFPTFVRRLADALALPVASAGSHLPPRAVRAWPGGHDFILQPAVRAEAARFLARHLSNRG